jgi:hypothetical protein
VTQAPEVRAAGDEEEPRAEREVATYAGFMTAITTTLDLALDELRASGASGRALRGRDLLVALQRLALEVAQDYLEGKRLERELRAFIVEATAVEDYDYARYFETHHGAWFRAFQARLGR